MTRIAPSPLAVLSLLRGAFEYLEIIGAIIAITIDSVLVENNVDASGATVDDHLEIAVTNSGSAELAGARGVLHDHGPEDV